MLRASQKLSRKSIPTSLRPLSQPSTTYLPFLYPFQQQWVRHSSDSSKRPPTAAPSRSASTSAFDINNSDVQLLSGSWTSGGRASSHIPRKPAGDQVLDSLLILNQPKLHTTAPRSVQGHSGQDKNDVLATFEACIRVGRIARAQLMLNNISKMLVDQKTLLTGAHNSFLQALLKRAESDGAQENFRAFFQWYEETMDGLKLKGDATTMCLLLRASLKMEAAAQGSRNIKKYIAQWVERGHELDELFQLDMLTPEEVVSVAKTINLRPDQLDEKYRELYTKEEPDSMNQITEVPEPVMVGGRGLGIKAVRQSLKSLIDPDSMPSRHMYGEDDMVFQIARQKLLEDDAFISAQEVWKAEAESLAARGLLSLGQNLNAMMWQWHQAMVPLIKQEIDRVTQAETNPDIPNAHDRLLYGPFLRVMSPEKVASITILELIKNQTAAHQGSGASADGMKTSAAVMAVGEALEQEYYAEEVTKKKNRDLFGNMSRDELNEMFQNPRKMRMQMKRSRERLQERNDPNMQLLVKWPAPTVAKLGAVLISMLLHCAKIPLTKKSEKTGKTATQFHPAIFHSYDYLRGRRIGVLKLHPELSKKIAEEPMRRAVSGRLLPMLVPPRPWMNHDDGGYYYSKVRVMRTKFSKEQEIYIQAASERGNLEKVFEGLDVLGQTAWRVNRKIFDIVIQVWNNGKRFADIPPLEMDVEMPAEPPADANPAVRIKWYKDVREWTQKSRANHSMRSDINLKIEIARAFLFERFYFPHNVDFRGRAYPIPPHLNHIGNDLSRGLLMFDKAKELGEDGLRWLKIHFANVSGYDKASFADRVRFAEEHKEEIIDSATKPLDGKGWWLNSEDPWQCLAACMALNDAWSLPDPTKYMCHLPVAMDGTCNGLQHYAALGGDVVGAKQVNLEPSDKPQDVYTGVADLVNAQIDIDAEQGHPLAKIVQGHVTRKVVKQSVMTNVYGVTFIGARAQIMNRLKENPVLPVEQHMEIATYLTRLVFQGISRIFTGATAIQNWLATAAKRVSRSVNPERLAEIREAEDPNDPKNRTGLSSGSVEFMTSVVWTTPLHMPIVQPYRKEKTQNVKTNLQRVMITDPGAIDQVHSRKQKTAFPPNFIHSLDATHMLMSAIKSAENGLTFASVHDSFWTHPSDVPTLNRVLRDAFIKLHSENLMEKLKQEFETRYKHFRYLTKCKFTTEQQNAVTTLRNKYKKETGKRVLTLADELQWESQRDALLRSEDPEERAKGEAIITPSVLAKSWTDLGFVDENMEAGTSLGELSDSEAGAPVEKKAVEHTEELAEEAEEVMDPAEDDAEIRNEPDDDESVLAADEREAETGEEVEEGMEEAEDMEEGEDAEEAEVVDEPTFSEMHAKRNQMKEERRLAHKDAKYNKRTCFIWLPLEFPPLPPKGDFDVSRLKDSDYFFS